MRVGPCHVCTHLLNGTPCSRPNWSPRPTKTTPTRAGLHRPYKKKEDAVPSPPPISIASSQKLGFQIDTSPLSFWEGLFGHQLNHFFGGARENAGIPLLVGSSRGRLNIEPLRGPLLGILLGSSYRYTIPAMRHTLAP